MDLTLFHPNGTVYPAGHLYTFRKVKDGYQFRKCLIGVYHNVAATILEDQRVQNDDMFTMNIGGLVGGVDRNGKPKDWDGKIYQWQCQEDRVFCSQPRGRG